MKTLNTRKKVVQEDISDLSKPKFHKNQSQDKASFESYKITDRSKEILKE